MKTAKLPNLKNMLSKVVFTIIVLPIITSCHSDKNENFQVTYSAKVYCSGESRLFIAYLDTDGYQTIHTDEKSWQIDMELPPNQMASLLITANNKEIHEIGNSFLEETPKIKIYGRIKHKDKIIESYSDKVVTLTLFK